MIATVALLAATTTGVDYLFKASVAAELPPDRLDDFFARYHAAVNAAALVLQLAVAPWLLQRLGVARALLVLPTLTTLGAAGVAAVGGLWPALGLRAADGALRPSLHGGASEILYLPIAGAGARSGALARGVRRAARRAGGRVGRAAPRAPRGRHARRGRGRHRRARRALLAAVAALRARYVERFRSGLSALSGEAPVEVPTLDLDALETLFAALASPDPEEVIGALELLTGYGRAHLIPPLILYHPSPRVVLSRARSRSRRTRRGASRRFFPWLAPPLRPRRARAPRSRRAALRRARIRARSARVLEGLAARGRPRRAPALARAVAALLARAVALLARALRPERRPGACRPRWPRRSRARRRPAHVSAPRPAARLAGARASPRAAPCARSGARAARAGRRAADPDDARARVRRHLPRTISRFPASVPRRS